MFDRSTIAALAAHAENEYAQAAEETGCLGLGLLVIFAIIVWRAYVRSIRNTNLPICSAAYGLGFGLLAITIHSFSDFGQHLPTNAFLSAVFCALLISLARMTINTSVVPKPVFLRSGRVRLIGVSLFILVIGAGGWAIVEANDARLAESHWSKALAVETDLLEKAWQGSNEEYIELIKNAAAAADYQPDNVKYRHWLNAYRWLSISGVSDPNTGNVIIPEPAMEFVSRIVSEFHKAITICPTYGPSWCVAGQLKKSILDDPTGEVYIQTGYRLAPCDPTVCFVAGLLDTQQGSDDGIEESFAKFKRAVQLDYRMFGDVANIYINQLNRPDLAVAIAGEDISRLSRVADVLANSKEHDELANKTSRQVVELLKLKCQELDTPAWSFASLGNIYRRQNENVAAIDCYRRALDLDYSQVYWRLNLAQILAKTGQIAEAVHEARICLRLQPEMKAAEGLIAELSVHPAAVEQSKESP
jgi:tetratricopeptide (TPR) repeat protein